MMKYAVLCCYVPVMTLLGLSLAADVTVAQNQRVIIGILGQEYNSTHQQIPASYVKYAESAGARVVPVFVGKSDAYYRSIVTKVNGLLLPGGDADLVDSDFGRAADKLLDLAVEINVNKQIHFPVWGTCMGFEKIITHYVGNMSWVSDCNVKNISLNLDIEKPVLKKPSSTKMFQDNYIDILTMMQNNRVAPNYHNMCLEVDTFEQMWALSGQFTLLSTNTYQGMSFVSLVEHKHYPIYGSAWHPEMNPFEFVVTTHSGHTTHNRVAVLVTQYLANFLVNEARKNTNHFVDKQEETNSLIYNYNQYRIYTGVTPKEFYEEMFIFPNEMVLKQ